MRRWGRSRNRRSPPPLQTLSSDTMFPGNSYLPSDVLSFARRASPAARRPRRISQQLDTTDFPALEPISSFSPIQGSSDVVPANQHRIEDSANAAIINNSTVIEILLNLLCKEYAHDPEERKMLFEACCSLIEQKNKSFYIPLHNYPQFQEFQANLQETLQGLFQKAQTRLSLSSNFTNIALPSNGSSYSVKRWPLFDDRYSREFIEEEILGEGAFGVVVKAKSNLDGSSYAIKMITVSQKEMESSLREVQALAQLSHPHIVRYHSTWLQFCVPRHHHSPSSYHTSGNLASEPCKPRIPSNSPVAGQSSVRITELSSSQEEDEIYAKDYKSEKIFYKSYIQRTLSAIEEESTASEKSKNYGAENICSTEENLNVHGICNTEENFEFVESNRILKEVSVLANDSLFQPNQFYEDTKSRYSKSGSSDDSIIFCDSQQISSEKWVPQSSLKIARSEERLKIFSSSQKSTSSDIEVVFSDFSEHINLSKFGKAKITALDSSSSSSSSNSETNNLEIVPGNYRSAQMFKRPLKMTLFIQLGLCGESLKEWLIRRNTNGSVVDQWECLGLFRQMIEAVHYIHSKHLIHRDIKPANIFFTLNQTHCIQLGDFGLARSVSFIPGRFSEQDVNPASMTAWTMRTQGVGTPVYAAPEIQFGGQYNTKSDMHSLGIILLELFQPFQTEAEKSHIITNLKTNQKLDPKLFKQWPDVAPWILKLSHPDPMHRPSASEVLESSLFHPSATASSPPNHRTFEAQFQTTSYIEKLESVEQSFYKQTKYSTDFKAGYSSADNVSSDRESEIEQKSCCGRGVVCECKKMLLEKEIECAKVREESLEKSGEILKKDQKIASLTEENSSLHILVAELQKQINMMKK